MTHRRQMGIAAVALLAMACAKGERQQAASDSTAGATSAAQRSAKMVGQIPAKPLPGALTKPIEQYTGAELYALVSRLTFTGGAERARRCKNSAGCGGTKPTKTTRVRVDAVAGEDSLGTNLPQYGVIAARASNRGGAADAMYGMRPGARYEYYLIVLPGPAGGSPTWQLQQLEVVGKGRAHSKLMVGKFVGCNHPFVPGARADFKTCAQIPVRPASFGMPMQGDEGFLWISCIWGCCVSEPGNPS